MKDLRLQLSQVQKDLQMATQGIREERAAHVATKNTHQVNLRLASY